MEYSFSYRIVAEALYAALTEDAFHITMEQSVTHGSARKAMIRYMDYSMVEAERHGTLVTADDKKSGAALWWRPLAPEIETQRSKNKRESIRQYVGSSSLESYEAMVAFMAEKSARQIDPQAWYLSIINIHPNAQGRGLGVHLVERILRQTDRLKRATYLETFSPRNISFYERFGYQTLDRVHEPTSKADYWLMVRGWRAGSDCSQSLVICN